MEPIPKVFKSTVPPPPTPLWRKKMPFLLLGLLILIILGEVIWGFQTIYGQNAVTKPVVEEISNLSDPQLVAVSSKANYRIGEIVPITIKVVTGGKSTDSTDLVIKYDPQILEVSGSNFVEIGRIYPDYPVANYDNVRGIAQVSGASLSSESGFSGIGTFAVLNFKAKALGRSEVAIDFELNSTTESNIVLSGTAKDILTRVTNADIIIDESSSVTEQAANVVSCTGYYQYCQLGEKTGKQFCQKGVLTTNQCSFDPKLTVSCGECQIE